MSSGGASGAGCLFVLSMCVFFGSHVKLNGAILEIRNGVEEGEFKMKRNRTSARVHWQSLEPWGGERRR